MSTGKAGAGGHPPAVMIRPTERAKYEQMWELPQYRAESPGELAAQTFLDQAKPKRGATVIDFGCGTGRGGAMLHALSGLDVTLMDFAENALDREVRELCLRDPERIRFVRHDLTQWPFPVKAQYGFCCDVLEHIPPAQVGRVLKNVVRAARHVFFQISCVPDAMGDLIGQPLHLTVRPFEWWLEQFKGLECHIHWSHSENENPARAGAFFYVSAFATGMDLKRSMSVNTSDDEVEQNILTNLRGGYAEVQPHQAQDTEIMLLGGGPSLAQFEDEIREKRAAGMPLVTTNGTYNWCLERGINPSAQVMVDSREFNKRFVHPVIPGCKYLLCSQVHPAVFESLPKDQILMWHSGGAQFVRDAMHKYSLELGFNLDWWPIYGGSTVMLRSIPLLRVLGYAKFHVYGFDSCMDGTTHHAYAQPENDHTKVLDLRCSGRTFRCTPWMWSQAHEFMEMSRVLGDVIDLEVYGDGLIAHIIATSAAMAPPDGSEPTVRYAFVENTLAQSTV